MNREEKLKHLMEMMNIPEIEEVMLLKLGEVEHLLAHKVTSYRNLRSQFHRVQRENITIFENDRKIEKQKAFEFKLERVSSSGKWRIESINPPSNLAMEEILPPEFIATLDMYKPLPNEIHSRRNYYSKSLKKYFTFTFCKYTKEHVLGNVFESTKEPRNVEEEKKPVCITFPNVKYREDPDLEKLVYYMQKYPTIREKILSHFRMTIFPIAEELDKNQAN